VRNITGPIERYAVQDQRRRGNHEAGVLSRLDHAGRDPPSSIKRNRKGKFRVQKAATRPGCRHLSPRLEGRKGGEALAGPGGGKQTMTNRLPKGMPMKRSALENQTKRKEEQFLHSTRSRDRGPSGIQKARWDGVRISKNLPVSVKKQGGGIRHRGAQARIMVCNIRRDERESAGGDPEEEADIEAGY